jgi:hypothetical protein
MDPGPDLEHHHHHHTGARWIDLVMAGSAILISLISLFVAVQHGRTMEQMVKATTWPNLDMSQSDVGPGGGPQISLSVTNTGVGPARIETFEADFHGQVLRNGRDLLNACCDKTPKLRFYNSTVPGRVLPAKDKIDYFVIGKAAMTDAQYEQLNRARDEVHARACYCSVLDECWIADSMKPHPEPVKTCPAPKAPYQD